MLRQNRSPYCLEALLLGFLVSWTGSASAGSVTAGGVSEMMAKAEVQRQLPKGVTMTDMNTECITLEVGFESTRYRCTTTWDD